MEWPKSSMVWDSERGKQHVILLNNTQMVQLLLMRGGKNRLEHYKEGGGTGTQKWFKGMVLRDFKNYFQVLYDICALFV